MNKPLYILTTLSVLISGFAVYKAMQQTKIAYVRSSELVYSYDGMKESQQLFQSKCTTDQANIDTLKIELQRAFNTYSKEVGGLKEKDKKERRDLLQHQEQNYLQYVQSIKEKQAQEETRMTEGVLNQVNSFIEQYSKEHGYDLVLGTTNSGNLLYAKEAMDITKEVLEALNAKYRVQGEETKN